MLTRNAPALATYLAWGMRARRDLRVLEWQNAPSVPPERDPAGGALVAWPPRRLLAVFDRLHPTPAAWQRDLPALLVRAGTHSLALAAGDRPLAYVLFQISAEGRAQLADLGAERVEQARILLAGLQQCAQQIVSVNEPADSPLMPAFEELGFVETDRQHELAIDHW